MYRIEISSFEKHIDTFRYQQKIKRYDIISIYRPTLSVALFSGTERLKCIDISSKSLYYVTFVTNKTSLLFRVADN